MNVQKNDPFIKRILAYTNERFPLIPISLFAAFITFNAFYCGQYIFNQSVRVTYSKNLLLGFISNFLLLFHLRLFDEFKDYDEDLKAYPERLLSKGVVTLTDLNKLIFVCIGAQIILNSFIGLNSFILWTAILIYSLLMYKEFFIPEFLNKTMALYLASHQLIVPIIVIYAFSLTGLLSYEKLFTPLGLYGLMVVSLPSFIFEIGRKTWNPEREKETADSYTKVWGIKKTSLILLLSILILVFFIHRFLGTAFFFSWQGLSLSLIFAVSLMLIGQFVARPTKRNSKLVEVGTSLILLLNHLLIILYFHSA